MDWLSQCVAYVKETLPPGTIVSGPQDGLVRGNNKRQLLQNGAREGFVVQENGKRRRVAQEEDVSRAHSTNGSTETRPPQYAWFHPSHPLHEDPRVTARRYNSGYDLESETNSLDGTSLSAGTSTEARVAGRRVTERTTGEQEPVNFERVVFAEQVLKPVYHSPYPEIKPDDTETTSRRIESKPSSSRRAQAEARSPGIRNGVFKIINGGTGIRRRERSVEVPGPTDGRDGAERVSISVRQGNGAPLEALQGVDTALEDQPLALEAFAPHNPDRPVHSHRPRKPRLQEEIPKEIHDDSEDEDYTPEATDRSKRAKPARPAQNSKRYERREESPRVLGQSRPVRHETQPEAPARSLWVCDRCFKYMPMESAYVTHTLYCQNLSLFGKLFIDHKSICFDVESFHYYVLTDSHPKRDHVIAYFCKEKFSIDDFNLATILVFPHVQQSGFGRLLMEFSYHLTKKSPNPGTPERPLSLLGARSYESLWMAMLVRYVIQRLLEQGDADAPKGQGKKVDTYMRVWERRKKVLRDALEGDEYLNYEDLQATEEELETQEEQVPLTATMTVEELARGCNLKADDLLCLLDALGVLDHRRLPRPSTDTHNPAEQRLAKELHLTDWSRTRVTIDWELVVRITGTWRIPAKPLLDEACCWIRWTGGPVCKPVPKKTWVGYM